MTRPAQRQGVRHPPAFALTFDRSQDWSRMLSTDQAGLFFGKSGRAIRAMILERADSDEVIFDGVWAKKLGNQWRVRIHKCWVGPSRVQALPERETQEKGTQPP